MGDFTEMMARLPGLEHRKVLIVDDSKSICARLALMVRSLGLSPLTASNGPEALSLIASESPAVVLLDVVMPDMDGYAVAAAIKALPTFVPVIMVTALGDFDAKQRGQRAGADDFLTKPVRPLELSLRIEAMLRIKSLTDAHTMSKARIAELVQSLPDGLVVRSVDGKILFANHAYATSLGFEAPELLGRCVLDLVDPSDRLRMQERDRAPHSESQPRALGVFQHARADGRPVVLEYKTIKVLDFSQQPAFLEVTRDVTESQRLRERLAISDRMASLGTLAAGVAHEINNPLAYVVGNLDFCRTEIERVAATGNLTALAEVAAALREASSGAERVRTIVRDIKCFSRGDEEPSGPIDLQATIESSVLMVFNEIRYRAQMVRDYRPVPQVIGTAARLGEVFINLLMNAAQAIDEGDAEHNRITVVTRTAADGAAVVEVSDTGSGIPASALSRLFDPFFTTKPVGVGTGLGLSICHGIVTSLHGEITVDTRVGHGTTFRVTLPPAGPAAVTRAAAPASPPPATLPRRGRILMVDDEPMVSRALCRLLSGEHLVVVEETAESALNRVSDGERFDLILCDLMMPVMTGIDLHRALTERFPEQARRIVFLTGGAFTPRARAFLETPGITHLNKPIDSDRLRELAREWTR